MGPLETMARGHGGIAQCVRELERINGTWQVVIGVAILPHGLSLAPAFGSYRVAPRVLSGSAIQ
jgi:hypothetical protein